MAKLVAGIDPGASGAIAVYDAETRKIAFVQDLPYWLQTVGAKKRKRLDPVSLRDQIDMLQTYGVQLVVLEAVGGRPQQSASSGFAFGYSVGLIYMACMVARLPIETVPPSKWKPLMGVPGKRGDKEGKKKLRDMSEGDDKKKATRQVIKQAEGDIMRKVAELFPGDDAHFRTERGAYRMDRADAALLAKFGGDYILRTIGEALPDAVLEQRYRQSETGA